MEDSIWLNIIYDLIVTKTLAFNETSFEEKKKTSIFHIYYLPVHLKILQTSRKSLQR